MTLDLHTLDLTSQISHPRSHTPDLTPQISHPRSRTPDLTSQITPNSKDKAAPGICHFAASAYGIYGIYGVYGGPHLLPLHFLPFAPQVPILQQTLLPLVEILPGVSGEQE